MKKVGIFSTTRADFGLLYPLIKEMEKDGVFNPLLFLGGTHLSKNHGYTIDEIIGFGVSITDTFDYVSRKDNSCSLSKSVGLATSQVATIFQNHELDFVCILGDRYELLSIVINAILFKKPIVHLHGGEKSEGAIDEQIRHMITKAAHLHFVSCTEYANQVRKTGESEWRIHNVGALGIDNIVKLEAIPKDEIYKVLGLNSKKPVALMTYHPVTLEYTILPEIQIQNIFHALKPFDLQLVITSPNVEVDRNKIISVIKDKVNANAKIFYLDSLGINKYLSFIPHCEFVIGNSSSGILEVPFFKIPTLNIGDRQQGRIRHESVIDTDYSVESIRDGIQKALSKEFKLSLENMLFKFGDGHAAEKIINVLKSVKINQRFMRKKLDFITA